MNQDATETVRSCIRDAMSRPGGPTVADVAQAMHLFVAGCWTQQLAATEANRAQIEKINRALYGDPESGADGLMDMKRDLCRLVRVVGWIATVVGAAVIGLLVEILGKI